MRRRRVLVQLVLLLITVAALPGCGRRSMSELRPDLEAVERIRQGLKSADAGDEAAAGASGSEPTGFATLRGRFVLEGDAPPPQPLQITKDVSICAPGGKQVFGQQLVVDPASRGIANVVIYAEKVPPEWVHADARPGKDDEVLFDQKECVFLTHVVAIQTSQKLRVLNSDPVGHNLAVASFNQTIPAGGYAIYEPLKEQRSPVEMSCSVHPWMKAWLLNRDNSYFAVSGPDGSFEIPNLPAGVELELRVWQEKINAVSDVTLNGSPTTWSKGKATVTLPADSDVEWNVTLDASLFQ